MRRGSEQSTIAKHPQRAAIEGALAKGMTLARIAAHFKVSADALWRYKRRLRAEQPQIFRELAAANWRTTPEQLDQLRIETSDGWLKQLRAQYDKLVLAQDRCLESRNYGPAAVLAAQVNRALQLVGQAVGEVAAHSTTVNNNLIVSPQYWAVRTAIVRALADYPEARRAVLEALRRTESDGGENAPPLALPARREPAAVETGEAAHA